MFLTELWTQRKNFKAKGEPTGSGPLQEWLILNNRHCVYMIIIKDSADPPPTPAIELQGRPHCGCFFDDITKNKIVKSNFSEHSQGWSGNRTIWSNQPLQDEYKKIRVESSNGKWKHLLERKRDERKRKL